MLNVALTGNIASGKSTVARLFGEWGATVIDADRIVHELQRPGTATFDAILAAFGPGVRAADGSLDRAALRQRVFADPGARAALNQIIHPAVGVERQRRLDAARSSGAAIVISDIPLLFEVMDPAGFDAVVLVDAPVETRRGRIMKDRQLDRTTADAMIAAQAPAESKRARATFVIDNDRDVETLQARTREVWAALQTLAGRPGLPR